MPRYTVNATLQVSAWLSVEADSEEAAYLEARDVSPSDWNTDTSGASLDFNVYPIAELES